MYRRGHDLVGRNHLAALPGELVIQHLNDGPQERSGRVLRLLVVGGEVEPAEPQEAVQGRQHAEGSSLREHAPDILSLRGQLLAELLEVLVLEAALPVMCVSIGG